MVKNYKRFFRHRHYSFPELLKQGTEIKSKYNEVSFKIKNGCYDGWVYIKPTEESIRYKLRIIARVNSTIVKIFPVEPYIGREVNGKSVPHMYPDGSLCLFYPDYGEWDYSDSWAETLIPWASLWLYYFEIWMQTGEWLGGGIHGKKKID